MRINNMRMKNKNTKKYLKNKSNKKKKKKRGRKNNKYKRNMVLDFFQVFYEERPLLRKHRNIFESMNIYKFQKNFIKRTGGV